MDGEMDARYEKTDGRKVVYASINPVKLLRGANLFTYIAIALILLLAAVVVLAVRVILKRRKKKKTV